MSHRRINALFCLLGPVIGAVLHVPVTHAQSLSPAITDSIDNMITAKMARDRIPGVSIAVAVDGEVIWTKGYGFADLENFVPATERTAFRSASIGKSITATAVMQLAERGSIDLDAPIQRYCSAFPDKRWPLTTRHLLGHLGGIRHYGGPRNEEELYSNVHYTDVIEPLSIFKDDSLLFEPGTRYLYSTYGYNVLGCVVEGAAGMRFMEFLHENIFRPAGMHHTRDDDPFALIPRRARGYRRSEDGSALGNSRQVDMSNKLPAGGYITTAPDLARFAAAFMNGHLVADSTRELMLTPQRTNAGEPVPYGLGWGLFVDDLWYGEREAFHGGGTPGVSGMLYTLPDRGFAVALLMNVEGVSERVDLTAQIAKLVLELGK